MFKLDRTYGKSGNLFSQKSDADSYKNLSLEEIGKIFAYLNSVAYNYPVQNPPKMDKTIYSSRKN